MALTTEQKSAKASLTAALAQYGLGGLATWAWDSFINGAPLEQIMLDLRDRPEYKTRFSGMEALRKAGRAVSEVEYINMEQSYASQMRAYGLPASFYDGPEDFGKLIGGEVSAKEFGDRLEMVSRVVAADPRGQLLRDELASKYGFTNAVGALIAWWIDPEKAEDVLQRQYGAAASSAASIRAGFGSLTKDQAERVGAGRYSEDYLTTQFGKLDAMDEFLTDIDGTGSVTKDDLIGAGIEGNADAAAKVDKTARKRVAAFQVGGNYASGQTGVTGLGSAST